MEFKFYQLTSAGDRQINQDCMWHVIGGESALFVVADGLGGHRSGEKASVFFCQGIAKFSEVYLKLMGRYPLDAMFSWISEAIKEMRSLFDGDPSAFDAYTTCAILYLDESQVVTAHCGDSRIYRMNPAQISWHTKDHTIAQQWKDDGIIREQPLVQQPGQNQLTRSINILSDPEPEFNIYPPANPGETFLLCTDGFWSNVTSQELLLLAQPQSGVAELEELSKTTILRAHGNSDNVTVQWLRNL